MGTTEHGHVPEHARVPSHLKILQHKPASQTVLRTLLFMLTRQYQAPVLLFALPFTSPSKPVGLAKQPVQQASMPNRSPKNASQTAQPTRH